MESVVRKPLNQSGLWNYDLRMTMSSYLQALLNHYDGRAALSHYYHVSFDALAEVVQRYADWLFSLVEKPRTCSPRYVETHTSLSM